MKNVKEYKQIDPDDIIFSQVLLHNIQRYDVVAICGTEINLFDLEDGEKVVKGDGENYSILLTPKKPKLMSFNQAKAKLQKAFIDFNINFLYSEIDGICEVEIDVFICDSGKTFTSDTFDGIFKLIDKATKPKHGLTKEESEQISEDIIPEG